MYKDLDKAYITFVNDDARPDMDQFADLFISKDVPLCLATIYDNLLNTGSNLVETRLETALRVQNAGKEILAHNAPVVTSKTITDSNFMYNYFVVQKQLLTSWGLDVNGIILAGGSGQITGSPITAKWTSALYKYSDLLEEENEEISNSASNNELKNKFYLKQIIVIFSIIIVLILVLIWIKEKNKNNVKFCYNYIINKGEDRKNGKSKSIFYK